MLTPVVDRIYLARVRIVTLLFMRAILHEPHVMR